MTMKLLPTDILTQMEFLLDSLERSHRLSEYERDVKDLREAIAEERKKIHPVSPSKDPGLSGWIVGCGGWI